MHAQRAVLKFCIGTKLQSCGRPAGRPAPSVSRYETSILPRFFWSPKRAVFWPFLALIQSFFCHFCDTSRNWTLFVVRIPPHSDFLGSVLRDITSPQVDKKYSFFDSTYETRSQFKGRLLRSEIFLRSDNIFSHEVTM